MVKHILNILLVLFIFEITACNISEPSEKSPFTQKIDLIFSEWENGDSPGGTVGVMKDGAILFVKSYGMASLEYEIPNYDSIRYNIASVSKQFTAYGILLLHQQGKLSLDDDIRKYLPELNDFGKEITIRHMLQHTSGLRSLHALLSMAGWRGDDTRTNDDLIRLMAHQKELNFAPGDEYLYCNTGFIFSAIIIERVTGKEFRNWMSENVFEPLGMNETYVEDVYNSVERKNATSYYYNAELDSYSFAVPYWGYTGSGNIHTNVFDMFKWLENFRLSSGEKRELFDLMFTNAILNNGDTINYALGINNLEYEGYQVITHGGSIGGFRSSVAYLPDEGYQVVVLSNVSNANAGGKMRQVVRALLNIPEPEQNESYSQDDQELKLVPSGYFDMAGDYYSSELMTHYYLVKTDSGIALDHPRHGPNQVRFIARDTFETDVFDFYLVRNSVGSISGLRASNGRVKNLLMEKVR